MFDRLEAFLEKIGRKRRLDDACGGKGAAERGFSLTMSGLSLLSSAATMRSGFLSRTSAVKTESAEAPISERERMRRAPRGVLTRRLRVPVSNSLSRAASSALFSWSSAASGAPLRAALIEAICPILFSNHLDCLKEAIKMP
jgi:hypothetical protein